METVMALTVALISIIGASALLLAIENHQRSSAAVADMDNYARIAMERLFREISETSNKTITIQTINVRAGEGLREDAISFASARNANGDFQSEIYSTLGFSRPLWQKAVVYYKFEYTDNKGKLHRNLYRKEITKTDWSANFDPTLVIDANGEVVAEDLDYIYFGPPYPETAPVITQQDHVLKISLGFLKTQEDMETGPARSTELTTAVPIMNSEK